MGGWMETVLGPGPVYSLSLGKGQQIRSLHFSQAVGSLVWGSLNSKQLIGPQGRVDIEVSPLLRTQSLGPQLAPCRAPGQAFMPQSNCRLGGGSNRSD